VEVLFLWTKAFASAKNSLVKDLDEGKPIKTIQGIIRNGEIHPSEPLVGEGQLPCLITIFDEDLEELRRLSQARLEDAKQEQLSMLLQINKLNQLSPAQEQELDDLLTEVHQLAAKRARAARLLDRLYKA
jgi:hypothetical protein